MEGTVLEVADRVWSCEQPDGPRRIRQVVIAGSAGALLVDTGLPESPSAGVLDLLDRLGLEVTVLLTHPDADHVGGTAAILQRNPGARLLAGTADLPLTGDPERAIRERYAAFTADDVPFTEADAERARSRFGPAFGPVEGVDDGASLDLGDRTVELMATPGHSPGLTTAWVPDVRVAAASDAVMGEAIPDRDGAPYIPPMYAPPGVYRVTIALLESLPLDLLLTAHEPVLDAAGAQAFLQTSRAACARMSALVREAVLDAPASLMAICERVVAAHGGLPADRVASLAMTVDGHLAELEAAGAVAIEPGLPRSFRRSA